MRVYDYAGKEVFIFKAIEMKIRKLGLTTHFSEIIK